MRIDQNRSFMKSETLISSYLTFLLMHVNPVNHDLSFREGQNPVLSAEKSLKCSFLGCQVLENWGFRDSSPPAGGSE